MPQPQQPEIRRSGENAAVDDHTKTRLEPEAPGGSAEQEFPVPEDNQPGHKPERGDQDKPDLDAFASRFGVKKG